MAHGSDGVLNEKRIIEFDEESRVRLVDGFRRFVRNGRNKHVVHVFGLTGDPHGLPTVLAVMQVGGLDFDNVHVFEAGIFGSPVQTVFLTLEGEV